MPAWEKAMTKRPRRKVSPQKRKRGSTTNQIWLRRNAIITIICALIGVVASTTSVVVSHVLSDGKKSANLEVRVQEESPGTLDFEVRDIGNQSALITNVKIRVLTTYTPAQTLVATASAAQSGMSSVITDVQAAAAARDASAVAAVDPQPYLPDSKMYRSATLASHGTIEVPVSEDVASGGFDRFAIRVKLPEKGHASELLEYHYHLRLSVLYNMGSTANAGSLSLIR